MIAERSQCIANDVLWLGPDIRDGLDYPDGRSISKRWLSILSSIGRSSIQAAVPHDSDALGVLPLCGRGRA
jgi:hypothetical protein